MEFQIKRGTAVLCQGKYPEAFYPNSVLKSIKTTGHAVLIDGKPYKETKEKGREQS